jgi:sugar O-acyltransferase (sialic acid O-acetyltransferase NeuD family)
MKDIAIYGAGGFGKEVATILTKINEQKLTWNLIGFFDDGEDVGTAISIYGKVLGGAEALNGLTKPISVVFAIGRPETLKKVYDKISNPMITFPNIIHPEVYMADERTLKIGVGNVIVRGCSFSCDVEIGDFNQFNSISALAHDVKVGSYNVLMPLTRISGEVMIGDGNLFGINSIVLQQIKIGDNKRFGPNCVLMTKPRKEGLYMGNPAKLTKL